MADVAQSTRHCNRSESSVNRTGAEFSAEAQQDSAQSRFRACLKPLGRRRKNFNGVGSAPQEWLLSDARTAPLRWWKPSHRDPQGNCRCGHADKVQLRDLVLCSLGCLSCTAPTSSRGPKGIPELFCSAKEMTNFGLIMLLHNVSHLATLSGSSRSMASITTRWRPQLSCARRSAIPWSAGAPARNDKDFARQGLRMAGTLRQSPLAEKITTFDTSKKRFCVFLRMEPFWGNGFSLH